MKQSVLLSLLLSIFLLSVNAQTFFQQNDLPEVEKAEITAKVNKTKIPWIKNAGQQQSEVAFYAETFSGTVFVTNTGEIVYSLPIDSTKSYVLRESFIKTSDVSKKQNVYGELQSQAKVNYFKGNNSDDWLSNVPTFQTVNLGEIWDGIEVKLNAYGNNIEKLFYISPGESYKNIQLELQGAKRLKISETGELIIKTPEGNIEFTAPIAYQIIENKKQYIEVAYIKNGKTYGFEVGDYNTDYTLIIDPLIASTFVGGSNSDRVYSIVLDGSNNVYITGGTYSSDYPATASSYDPTYNDKWEVFVSKFTPDLSTILASTFLGGGDFDVGLAMTLDGSGNVYVTGYAHSGFPVTSLAYDETNNGMEDVFVAKLSPDLSTLQASTFIGGLSTEYGYSIAIDGSGNVLVTGCTYSSGYPTAGTPYNDDPNGYADIYISKFTSDLSSLLASTFVGSSNDDYAYSIVLDGSDNVFITGFTFANNYPTAGSPYDNTYNGSYDAIISKFTSDLSTLTASTYLGGNSDEWGHSIIFDTSGNLLITGFTYSDNFPTAGTPYDDSQNGGADVFVTKINSDLSTLSASTFIGGSLSEEGHSIAIDNDGNIFVSGHTKSSDYPMAGSPYNDSHNGGVKDINVSKLSSDLSTLLASTFIGGNDDENSNFLAVDNSGNIFVSGYSESGDYPTTSSSFDDSYNGSEDAIISKLDNNLSGGEPLPEITSQPENQTICEGENAIFSLTATGADSYQWQENAGSGFENITEGDIYSGAETNTLTITEVSSDMTNYEYQCIVANSYGNAISNIAVLTVITSIETIQNTDSIKIYPNPSNGIFTIHGKNIQTVEIVNISGQTIKQLSIDPPSFHYGRAGNYQSTIIDLKGHPKGVYFVKIQTNNQIFTNKLILK